MFTAFYCVCTSQWQTMEKFQLCASGSPGDYQGEGAELVGPTPGNQQKLGWMRAAAAVADCIPMLQHNIQRS